MRVVGVGLLVPVVCAFASFGPGRVNVSITGHRPAAVLGRPWTVRLAVRPSSFRGRVTVTASGSKLLRARAARRGGAYRVRLVFPSAGRWRLTAHAGGSTSRLGTVQVAPAPLVFTQPTSIDLEPAGTLLLVENNPGRLLRIDPGPGRTSAVIPALTRPYAVVRSPSGDLFLSAESRLLRIGANGARATVATAGTDIGPVAVAASGDVYYATATQIFRLAGGSAPPVLVAGTGTEGGGGDGGPALEAQFSDPHGLAVASDGALLVADTGNDRIRRIDPATGVITALAPVLQPDGLDVASDGTVYAAAEQEGRVVRFAASGSRIGFIGPAFATPYDVEAAPGGVIYVLEAGSAGRIRRVAADGTVTTVSRRR
jgi:sugar lactone lactonase YvrE